MRTGRILSLVLILLFPVTVFAQDSNEEIFAIGDEPAQNTKAQK